jgi:hypothetical protein
LEIVRELKHKDFTSASGSIILQKFSLHFHDDRYGGTASNVINKFTGTKNWYIRFYSRKEVTGIRKLYEYVETAVVDVL